jgi:ketosteroid isomerase-like protein
VSQEQNIRIAQQLLAGIGEGEHPEEIAALFSVDVQFEIAGDVGALPWIGRRTGRSAASDFIRDARRLIEQLRFDVQDILASDDRAVIVGELATRINATREIIESAFALILTVSDGEITRFQMLEDSFAVSRAARP